MHEPSCPTGTLLRGQHKTDREICKRHSKEGKLIFPAEQYKNLQQNISKSNPTVHKKS
jgi:hypothetical protein